MNSIGRSPPRVTLVKSGETSMAKIDTDELRDYLEDYCGTAASSGFPAALLDVADIENMDGYELCEKAEDLGIDLGRFRVDK